MDTLTIYSRVVRERKLYGVFKYVETKQISVFYGGKELKNHPFDTKSKRLKTKFVKEFETNVPEEAKRFVSGLGSRKNADLWLSSAIKNIMGKDWQL